MVEYGKVAAVPPRFTGLISIYVHLAFVLVRY
jgi:hypothetical protein